MAFSVGFGPFRWYSRSRYTPSDPLEPEEIAVLLIGAVGTLGAWGAVEGLSGSWGVTGRVFGVVFVLATLASFTNWAAATVMLSSWTYWGLAQLGYFGLIIVVVDLAGQPELSGSVDAFVGALLTWGLSIAAMLAIVLAPPFLIWRTLRWLERNVRSDDTGHAPDQP